jgi:hypothetical protein
MLEFFRKFQKVFFLAVTVVLIISFFFFGIFSTLTPGAEQEDRSIGKAVDGSDIQSLAMGRLVRFLSSDADEGLEPGSSPNFLNDGVMRKDFLETGLGILLAGSYFEELKEDLQTRLARAKTYRSYAHPEAPFLSVQAIWDQFRPDLSRALSALKGQLEVSPDTFTYLTELYLEQKKLSPEVVRRILMYQMGQYSSIRADRSVQHQDFSIFGYHNLREWFGEKWIEKAAEFVWNSALVAEEKGFAVTEEEAKADLLLRLEEASQKRPQMQSSLQTQVQRLGMTEKEALETWQKVMLFRRYMNSVGETVLLDHVLSKDLADYAQQIVLADVYSLPEALTLKTADDFFALQYYLDTAMTPEKDRLSLPTSYRAVEEVAKKAPQFVETLFTAEVSRISRGELALGAALKDVLQWQFAHWDLLCAEFPALTISAQTRSERAAALEKLEPALRAEADDWVRFRILEDHPEWIEEAFKAARSSEQTFSFSAGRVNTHYVQDPSEFLQMLDLAALGEEKAAQYLSSYSDGGTALYRISQVKKTKPLQIRTLASMKQDGTLKKVLDRHLEQQYPKIREKHSAEFKTKSGDWKPFAEAKEQIGWVVYADVCRALETKEKLNKPSSAQYIQARLAYPMRSALKEMRDAQAEPQVLPQFQLVRQEKKLERTIEPDALHREAFTLEPQQWSSVHFSGNGQISFFYVKEKNIPSESGQGPTAASKAMLSNEAMHMLAKRIIHRMQEN